MTRSVAIVGAGQISGNDAWIFGDSGHWDVRWLSRGFAEAAHPSKPYARAIGPIVRRLAELDPADWRAVCPQLATYPWNLFDYEAEDRSFQGLA